MKKLTMSILLALAVSASAQTFTAPAGPRKPRKVTRPPPISQREPQGALQRGARGGNVLQMLNPKAPPEYGTSADSLIMDETGKWRGIKFLEFFF
jgi:hypothetical protein